MRVKAKTKRDRDLEKAFVTARSSIEKVILAITRNIDAVDDVSQNAYLKAWRAKEQFKGDSSLKTWLCTIARNEALIYLKKGKRYAIHLDTIESRGKARGLVADEPYYCVRASNVEKAIDDIPSDILRFVLRKRMEGYSERELGLYLNIPEGTVKSRYRRAKEYLVNHKELT